ncbi:MAG: alpha/beta hydrolase, partial [Acidobacteriota bacterium]
AAASGRLKDLPPILTFQSIVDATVSTSAVVHLLYDRMPANGSELVLFDVNHVAGVDAFMRPSDRSIVGELFDANPRLYRRVLVTNVSPETRDDDPLYGIEGPGLEAGLIPLGRLSPRGEKEVLAINSDSLMRLTSNPFFALMAERIRVWLAPPKGSVQ